MAADSMREKEYAIVWADGQRGIVLAETTRMGDGKRRRGAQRAQASNGRSVSTLSAVASSVRRRSPIKSSTSSIPTESRKSASVIPRRSRSSFGIEPCVIRAGWEISDSTPPRLSARLK